MGKGRGPAPPGVVTGGRAGEGRRNGDGVRASYPSWTSWRPRCPSHTSARLAISTLAHTDPSLIRPSPLSKSVTVT